MWNCVFVSTVPKTKYFISKQKEKSKLQLVLGEYKKDSAVLNMLPFFPQPCTFYNLTSLISHLSKATYKYEANKIAT